MMGQAGFQQRNGMYGVNIISACGVFTPEQFAKLGQAAQECAVFRLKLTTRQTVVAVLPAENIPALLKKLRGIGLRVSPHKGAIRAVKACSGNAALCPRSLADALDLGIKLQDQYLGIEVPRDLKIAVSGCPRGCTEPLSAGFGIMARGAGIYDIYLGGRGGGKKPVHGRLLAGKVSTESVFKLLDYVIERYRALAHPKESIASTVNRLGIDPFLPPAHRADTDDSEGLDDD